MRFSAGTILAFAAFVNAAPILPTSVTYPVSNATLQQRQWKIPRVFRRFGHSEDAIETFHIEPATREAHHESPTKNARPFDQAPSYMPTPEGSPDGLSGRQNQDYLDMPDEEDIVKRQRKVPPAFHPLVEPTTLEKRAPPRTAHSTIAEPTSAFITELDAAAADDDDEQDRKWCGGSRKCTTSATCRGACDACTYVAWYPYGICMERNSGRGKIRD